MVVKTYMFKYAHICGTTSHIYVHFERYVSPENQICGSIYVGFRHIYVDSYMWVHICWFSTHICCTYMSIFVDICCTPPLAYMCFMAHICAHIYVGFRHIYVAHICPKRAHICGKKCTYMCSISTYIDTIEI